MDFAQPNAKPGPCAKCRGSGVYRWGAVVNGRCEKQGPCFSCKGTGHQDAGQIIVNRIYNRHKFARVQL
jgi:DnaJ-class molecular chaperone